MSRNLQNSYKREAFEKQAGEKIAAWEDQLRGGDKPNYKEPICQVDVPDCLDMEKTKAVMQEICAKTQILSKATVGLPVDIIEDHRSANGPQVDIYRKGYAPVSNDEA